MRTNFLLAWCGFFLFFSFVLNQFCFFNLNLHFFFNWRIIALQCYVGFCHAAMWISFKYADVSSLLKLAPAPYPIPRVSWFSEHWAGLPVLCGASHWLAGSLMVVYIPRCHSLSLSHALLPLLGKSESLFPVWLLVMFLSLAADGLLTNWAYKCLIFLCPRTCLHSRDAHT